ncbi:putative Lipid binding protein [Melia azedarach]|uniref:Lipid binding protein n=1 Tax=Melia azedarach TaxID=155640 RepID=A0ACC1Y009_MELAZ|nr:putative Lipid binding protein [Melia azedarach]
MAASNFITLAFFITLSFSSMDVTLGAARRLLQTPSNLPTIPGVELPPFLTTPILPPITEYPEYRLPPFATTPLGPDTPTGFPTVPFFAPPAVPTDP